ncbi:MAG TPA: 16S rRNA (uracil(1498)-N(3))-methyltransferase [Mycobacteriales bacterium]|nr:16S rRNA (uracil(1498)-N(3))-methyltransferase [Mycobacteriales bacterium]
MTTRPVFLVDALPDGASTVLDGAEGHHAATVRRLRPGEELVLSDGAGGVADCVVAGPVEGGLQLAVTAVRRLVPPDPRFVLVQALAKGDRGELAVELAVELGVDEVVPWAASRSVVRWDGARGQRTVERWRSTARAAAKQSRRVWLPSVAEPASTRDVSGLIGAAAGALVLHEAADVPLGSVPLPDGGDLVLVVGPEGGLGEAELAEFTEAGATAVRLGAPVLRTSTAGAAALAALSLRTGRWD